MKRDELVKIAKRDVGKSRDEVGCAGNGDWCAWFVSNVLIIVGIGEGVTTDSCTLMQRYMSENENWDEPLDYPIPGDIIFFDWDNKIEERPLDHVAICVDFQADTGQITYVNGNGSSSHYVTEQVINVEAFAADGHKYVAYWMRYIGDHEEKPIKDLQNEISINQPEKQPEDKPTEKPVEKEVILKVRQLRKGMNGGDVKTLQRLLFADGYSVGQCGDDGEFGNDTENAVIKYQRDHALDPDGIAGINTLTALWKCEPIARKRK